MLFDPEIAMVHFVIVQDILNNTLTKTLRYVLKGSLAYGKI